MSDAIRPGASSGDPWAEPTLPRLADICRSAAAAAAPPLLPDSSGPTRPPDPPLRYPWMPQGVHELERRPWKGGVLPLLPQADCAGWGGPSRWLRSWMSCVASH